MPSGKSKLKILWQVFLTFMKIGGFTFGGGYAMLPLIEHICIEKNKWMTPEEMADIIVIAESSPGPIAINCSTFVGYRQAGIPGAVAGTLGMVLPSFVIIFLISMYLGEWLGIKAVAACFKGIKIAVGILIGNAGLNLMLKMERNFFTLAIMIISGLLILGADLLNWHVSVIAVMFSFGALSYIIFSARQFATRKSPALPNAATPASKSPALPNAATPASKSPALPNAAAPASKSQALPKADIPARKRLELTKSENLSSKDDNHDLS